MSPGSKKEFTFNVYKYFYKLNLIIKNLGLKCSQTKVTVSLDSMQMHFGFKL